VCVCACVCVRMCVCVYVCVRENESACVRATRTIVSIQQYLSLWKPVAKFFSTPTYQVSCSLLQCVAVRRIVLQCAAVCCSALQCVVVRCSVLQCVVAKCCSALQCDALC